MAAHREAPVLFVPVGVGGRAAASPPRAGKHGGSPPRSRRLQGGPEPSTSALQRARGANTAGTEPGRYDDFDNRGDAGLGCAGGRRGSPGHQHGGAAVGAALGRGGWLWPPRPSAPLQPAAFAEHPQQSPGNIRAEGEPQMWRQLWAWSPCWAASVGRAGALPHRLQGRGLRPPPPAPNRIPGSVRTSPAPISHRGDAHARPLSEPCGGCGAVGWCQAEPFERLEKSSSPRAGGRASCLT